MLLWLARGFHSHFSYLSFLLHRVFSLLLKLYSCSLFLENVYPHSVIGEDLMCVSWGCLPFTILLILTQSQWSVRSFLWRNGWDLRRSGQPVTTKPVSANNISLLESFLNISWVQEFTWIHIPFFCRTGSMYPENINVLLVVDKRWRGEKNELALLNTQYASTLLSAFRGCCLALML